MIRRKTIIGLCSLCAIFVSAFAAQGASAAGTTAFTCKQVTKAEGTAGFSKAHCKPADAVATNAKYEHFPIANGTKTEVAVSDLNTGGEHTGAIVKFTVAGSAIELIAKEVSGSGTMSNSEVGGEMIASGEGSLKYSGVTESLMGCKVTGKPGGAKVVETKQLAATTAGVGDKLKVTPNGATPFAEFELTECAIGPITIKVFDSAFGVPDGATVNTVHNTMTAEKTLRLQNATTGPLAGLEGTLTISGRANSGEPYTPLSPTT
ncbi:MAG: hypothetical protein ACOYD4_09110 [Solirubrobacterales bacterium]